MKDSKRLVLSPLLILVLYLSFGFTHSVVNSDKSKPHISSEKSVSLSKTFPPAQNWSTEKLSRAREYANEIGS